MRFSALLFSSALAVLVSAQDPSTPNSPTPNASPVQSVSPAQSSVVACINACREGDVNCRARCISVPSPNDVQVNATNTCVSQCPKGSGGESDNEAYKACVSSCIGNNYFHSSGGTPQQTGPAGGNGVSSAESHSGGHGSATATGGESSVASSARAPASAGSTASSGSASGSGNASPTNSGGGSRTTSGSRESASATSTNAASPLSGSSAAALGFFIAVLAL